MLNFPDIGSYQINIGERSGSGIPSIFSAWRKVGYDEPEIVEMFEPERIKLQLKFTKIGDKKSAIKGGIMTSTERIARDIESLGVISEVQGIGCTRYT